MVPSITDYLINVETLRTPNDVTFFDLVSVNITSYITLVQII